MQRIIQKYQEGGTVQPATATGLPAGGNAASAIANYMMGPMSANAATLSYTGGGGEGVPDYHALALEQKKLREAAALIELQSQIKNAGNTSSGEDKMEERKAKGGDLYQYNPSTDPATVVAQNEENRLGIDPSGNQLMFSGGGADGVGNFGKVGDFFGGVKDKIFGSNMGGPIGYNMGSMKKPVGYNMGTMTGPIGYNMGSMKKPVGYNAGGVSQVARTMLPEEQIQQRQMQQAQFAQGQGPLAEIGNALGMKVAGAGVDKAMGKMAGNVAMKAAMGSIPVVGPFLAALFN